MEETTTQTTIDQTTSNTVFPVQNPFDQPAAATTIEKQNLWWLIKHSFNILFKHNSWNERISKGEDIAASVILGFVGSIASIIGGLVGKGSILSLILVGLISIAIIYFTLKLLKQRFNDLNLGAKGMRWYIGGSILTVILGLIAGLMMTKSIIIGIVFGVAALIVGCFVLWYKLLLQFENGSQGDNKYGSDPLLRQPYSNKPYIIFVIVVPAIVWLLLMGTGLGGSLLLGNIMGSNPIIGGDNSSFGGSQLIPRITDAQSQARDTARKASVQQLVTIIGAAVADGKSISSLDDPELSNYGNTNIQDPKGGQYSFNTTAKGYIVCADLEKDNGNSNSQMQMEETIGSDGDYYCQEVAK